MAVAEAERVLTTIRVPNEGDFEDNASDWLEARDVADLAKDLIGRYPELAELEGFQFRFAWKREGGKDGEAGFCKRLSSEARFLAGVDFFIWIAADLASALSQRQIEALVYHELCHAGVDEKGRPKALKHDVELFFSEVRRYGAWNLPLEGAWQTFQQLPLPL